MHRTYHPEPVRPKKPFPWAALAFWGLVVYAATGVYTVSPNERAVVRRFGRVLPEIRQPGLHFGLPWGLDRVDRVRVSEQKRVTVGGSIVDRDLGRPTDQQGAEYLTGDRNLVQLTAVVQYRIADPKAYLYHAADVPKIVADAASASLARAVSGMTVDAVLTTERPVVQQFVRDRAMMELRGYDLGVEITGVTLERAAPPREVQEAFRDVTAALEDKQRLVREAEGYAASLKPQTEGRIEQILAEATGYRESVLAKARGDTQRFESLRNELAAGRERIERRLLLQTLEEVVPRMQKVMFDDNTADRMELNVFEAQP